MDITIDLLKKSVSKLGYKWYADRPNLIGIRTTLDIPDIFNDLFCLVYSVPAMAAGLSLKNQKIWLNSWGFRGVGGVLLSEDGVPGKNMDNALQQYAVSAGKERLKIFPDTTNPGVFVLNHPEKFNKLGAAILKPGQWVDSWARGWHHLARDGQTHRALVQTGTITVYRDNNRDNNYQLNVASTQTGNGFYINIHGANKIGTSPKIGSWSAGCQVFANWADKELVMDICDKFKTATANKFTYTLIDEKNLS